MKLVLAAAVVLLVWAGYVIGVERGIKITPVSSPADIIACGQAGGAAAMLATIDETGALTSDFFPACVVGLK